jgi:hypothetical protein
MSATISVEYECCGARYDTPTRIPDNGSALHHATTVDTVTMLADAWHDQEHPDCKETPK